MKRFSVVIFGHGSIAIWLSKYLKKSKKYKLVGVVGSSSESIYDYSIKQFCLKNKIKFTTNLQKLFNKKSYDIGISVYYDRILPSRIIKKFSVIVNNHNSLLPLFKGVNPVNWAFELKKQVGVTFHKIETKVDSGPYYFKNKIKKKRSIFETNIQCFKQGKMNYQKFLINFSNLKTKKLDTEGNYYSRKDSKNLKKYANLNNKKSIYKTYGNYIFNKKIKDKSILIIAKNNPEHILKNYKSDINILIFSQKKIKSNLNYVQVFNPKKFKIHISRLIFNKNFFSEIYIEKILKKEFNFTEIQKLLSQKNQKLKMF